MSDWLRIQKFESKSSPGKYYWVSIHPETKTIGCDCKAWIFKKSGKPRNCKHLNQVEPSEVRRVLGLNPNSPEFTSRVIRMKISLDNADIEHGRSWWAARKIKVND